MHTKINNILFTDLQCVAGFLDLTPPDLFMEFFEI